MSSRHVLTLAAVLLAGIVLARRDGAPERSLAAQEAAVAEPSCREHGCGCPHEQVVVDCCCEDEGAGGVALEPPRAPAARTAVLRSPPVRSVEHASAVIVGFQCAKGPRAPTALGTGSAPLVAHVGSPASAGPTPLDARLVERERGPLFDLDTQPSIPPPRSARA